MVDGELSDQDKVFKAQAVQQRMELEKDLKTFGDSLDQIFKIAPPLKLTPVEKDELTQLSTAIRGAAATNSMRARVLELLRKGIGG